MVESQTKLKNRVLSRTKKNFSLSWAVLLIPFLFISFRLASSSVGGNYASEKFTNYLDPSYLVSLLGFNSSNIGGIGLTIFIKFIFIALPIISLTIFEFYNSKGLFLSKFRDTSLGKIRDSEGYKNADYWYYILYLATSQFQILVVFLTLGLININYSLETWFHNIYESLVQVPQKGILPSLIMVIAILISDLIEYAVHRIQHKVPFLWDLHEFHHSPTEMTLLSKDRGTLLDQVFTFPIFAPISTLIALLINESLKSGFLMPFLIYMLYAFMIIFTEHLGHSSTKVIFPKPISYFWMSPSLHWIHHSNNPEHYDSNLGMRFPFWDKLFGTYIDETHLEEIYSYGVDDSQYNKFHPLYSFSILPVLKIVKRVRYLFNLKSV